MPARPAESAAYGHFCKRRVGVVFGMVLRGEWELARLLRPVTLVCTNSITPHTWECRSFYHEHTIQISPIQIHWFCELNNKKLLGQKMITEQIDGITLARDMNPNVWVVALYPLLTRLDRYNVQLKHHLLHFDTTQQSLIDLMLSYGALSSIPISCRGAMDTELYNMFMKPCLSTTPSRGMVFGKYSSGFVQAVAAIGTTHGIPLEMMLIIFEIAYGVRLAADDVSQALAVCRVKVCRNTHQSICDGHA